MVKLGQPLLHCVSVGFLALKVQFSEEVVPSVAVPFSVFVGGSAGSSYMNIMSWNPIFLTEKLIRRTAWRYLPALETLSDMTLELIIFICNKC